MEKKILYYFGNAIRHLRTEMGLSQEQFAEKCGLHRTYIGQIERGERNPSLINIEKFSLACDIELSKLFEICEQLKQLK